MEPAPSHADHGRSELFKAYMKGRYAAYGLVLGCSAAFIFGAWKGSPLVMAALPAAVALGVAGIAFYAADRGAAQRFWSSYAASLGLTLQARRELLALTPLLGAGDKRWCENWMEGTLPGEPALAGGLGHFVYEDVESRRDSDGDLQREVRERRRFTLCVIELEPSLALFKGVYLRPRKGIFDTGKDWLRRSGTDVIELESSAFTQRYELRLASDQDELRARQLLSPSLVSWLAGHPLAPCFELKAGTLVVFLPRVLEDAGKLTFFVDAARHLAIRVMREVTEAAARPAA